MMKRVALIFLFFLLGIYPAEAYGQVSPEEYDVIIDVGHGGVDGGTSASPMLEKEINLQVGKRLYQYLRSQNVTVGITRLHDYALSDDSPFGHILSRHSRDLMQRKLIAESLNPRIFLSLHVNWSSSRRSHGPLVIYQPTNQSYALAQLLQQHLNAVYKTDSHPVKGKKYFLMKKLDMPSVIIEMGYISNSQDLAMMTDKKRQGKLVEAIAHAVSEYLLLYP